MYRPLRTALAIGVAAASCVLMSGCTPDYSPNTYASNAAQQANKVNQGVVVGVRAVQISADTTLATATGGAAGGIVGSGFGEGAGSAVGAVAGTVAGGVVGNVVGHAAGDTNGFEYIVKKSNGDLLSVTQKDPQPLGIGAHVLLIEGPQARIVPDYTVPVTVEAPHPEETKPGATAKSEPATTPLGTVPPAAAATTPPPAPAAAQAAAPPATTTSVVTATPLAAPSQPAPSQPVPAQPTVTQPEPAAATPPPTEKATTPPAETPPAKPEDTAPKPASGS